MNFVLKIISLAVFVIITNIVMVQSAYAIDLTDFIGGPFSSSNKICEIRRLFCGNLALAIVGFAMFTMGIMILNQKLRWTTAMIIMVGVLVFIYPEDVIDMFGFKMLIIPTKCSCPD